MQELLTMIYYGDFGFFPSSFDSAAKMYLNHFFAKSEMN